MERKPRRETPLVLRRKRRGEYDEGYIDRVKSQYGHLLQGGYVHEGFLARLAVYRLVNQRGGLEGQDLEVYRRLEFDLLVALKVRELTIQFDGCRLTDQFIRRLSELEVHLDQGTLSGVQLKELEVYRTFIQGAVESRELRKQELIRSQSQIDIPAFFSKSSGYVKKTAQRPEADLPSSGVLQSLGVAQELLKYYRQTNDED